MNIKQMREQRAKLVADAQDILGKIRDGSIPAEQRAEKQQEVDRLLDQSDVLKGDIDREERAQTAQQELDAPTRGRVRQDPNLSEDPKENQARYAQAFRSWAIGGMEGLEPEQRAILRDGFRNEKEQRAQTVTTTAGGYLIPNDWVQAIESAMKSYSGTLAAPTTKWRTDTGALIPYPTVDDTSNKGALLGINTQESAQDLTFGVENFNAYKFTSKNVLVPIELMQDSAFDLNTFLTDKLGERIGRICEQYFTTGTGTAQPEGIVTGSTAGYTAAASNAIAYNDLVELKHSVDPAYRTRASAGWMMNDSTLKVIRKMVDGYSRPLWEVSVQAGDPDQILGHPYFINQEMASIEASAKSILFGDLSKFIIRHVTEMVMMRLVERYADYYQIGFQTFHRCDARLVDAGTRPIKHLLHPSP
jgi:HK97 family phage major capsid protein